MHCAFKAMRVGLIERKHLHLFAEMMPVWSVVLRILPIIENKCKHTGLLQSVQLDPQFACLRLFADCRQSISREAVSK